MTQVHGVSPRVHLNLNNNSIMEQTKKYPTIDEVIGMLEDEIDYDPTPNEPGEPPITAAEMHAAAWKEHQEMHR